MVLSLTNIQWRLCPRQSSVLRCLARWTTHSADPGAFKGRSFSYYKMQRLCFSFVFTGCFGLVLLHAAFFLLLSFFVFVFLIDCLYSFFLFLVELILKAVIFHHYINSRFFFLHSTLTSFSRALVLFPVSLAQS